MISQISDQLIFVEIIFIHNVKSNKYTSMLTIDLFLINNYIYSFHIIQILFYGLI